MKYEILLIINYTKKLFRNPSRMFLTLTGLILSVVIVMIGLIFSETYLESKLTAIESYKAYNANIVKGPLNYDIYSSLKSINTKSSTLNLYNQTEFLIEKIGNGRNISVFARDVRTNNMQTCFMTSEYGSDTKYSANLLEGRLINEQDIEDKSNVTVITSSLATILFGEASAVGEKISLPVYELNEELGTMQVAYYTQLEVIGVISDSKETIKRVSDIVNSNTEADTIEFLIYVPLSYQIAEEKNNDYEMEVVMYSEDNTYENDILNTEEIISSDIDQYSIINYLTLQNNIDTEIDSIRKPLGYIVLFIFIVSGLSIANTMFFSVKERITEIGIRKSIGAMDDDIVLQFITEGIIYGVIGAVTGIFFSIFISSCVFILIKDTLMWNNDLVITGNSMILSLVVSLMVGIISSILPAIYASKIRITEAIKYD